MINFAELKKFFLYNLIGSLIIAALVAVVTVLVGEFNEVASKVLITLSMVMLHSLISLAFIWDDKRQNTFTRLNFFINVLFIVIILSFLTSLFGIWEIIPGDIVWQLYQTYFLFGFASLHGNVLAKALNKEKYMDTIIYINFIFMGIVVLMLEPIIFTHNASRVLGDVFFRILGAVAIIDGTLSILTMIFYKLYMNKNPKVENPFHGAIEQEIEKKPKKGFSVWIWILLIFLLVQIAIPLFKYIFSAVM